MEAINLREEIAASFKRLPKVQRALLELLLAGYYRITYTEDLIQHVNTYGNEYDKLFWQRALNDERGHARVYYTELKAITGALTDKLIASYVPCPQIVSMLAWTKESHANAALYRAYLEYGLLQLPEKAFKFFEMLLPYTMRLHKHADLTHSADCFVYMESFNHSADEWRARLSVIEAAFVAEINHTGLFEG